jgi:hypothetical protein
MVFANDSGFKVLVIAISICGTNETIYQSKYAAKYVIGKTVAIQPPPTTLYINFCRFINFREIFCLSCMLTSKDKDLFFRTKQVIFNNKTFN